MYMFQYGIRHQRTYKSTFELYVLWFYSFWCAYVCGGIYGEMVSLIYVIVDFILLGCGFL